MGVGARLSFRERLQPLVRLMVAHQPPTPTPHHDETWQAWREKKWMRISFQLSVIKGVLFWRWRWDGWRHQHATCQFISHHRPNIQISQKQSMSCKEEACHTVNKKNAQIFNHRSIVLHRPTVHKTQLLGPNEAPSCQWTHQTQLKSYLNWKKKKKSDVTKGTDIHPRLVATPPSQVVLIIFTSQTKRQDFLQNSTSIIDYQSNQSNHNRVRKSRQLSLWINKCKYILFICLLFQVSFKLLFFSLRQTKCPASEQFKRFLPNSVSDDI